MEPDLRPLSEDTSPEAEALLLEHYRSLDAPEKVRIALELSRRSAELALQGIRERHPEATGEEQLLHLAALKYGREIMVEAFDWDPLEKGW